MFAGFAEHPADGFMNEVVGVVEEDGCNFEGPVEGVFLDKVEGGDDGDPFFP